MDEIRKPMKRVRKKRELNTETEKRLYKSQKELVCECLHNDNGQFTIRPTGRKTPDGQMLYVCKDCGKEINLANLTDEQINSAISTIDRMCDVIKMLLSINSEQDEEIYKRIAKLQFRTTVQLKDLYNAAKNKNKSGNRNGNRNRNNQDSGWRRPVSN